MSGPSRRVNPGVVAIMIVLGLLTAAALGVAVPRAVRYFAWQQVTAHVDRCYTFPVHSSHWSAQHGQVGWTHDVTRCYGTWRTADGRTHHALLGGVTSQRAQGTDVRVDVSHDSASRPALWSALWPFGLVLLAAWGWKGVVKAVRGTGRVARAI